MPDEEDQNLNPGQRHYESDFGFKSSVNFPDKDGGDDNNNENIDDVQDKEKNPDVSWKNNFNQEKEAINYIQSKDIKKGKAMLRLAKRKGPLAAIILSLGGGGLIISTLLSPSLLLVNIKEVMVEKFNYQNTSMSVRTTKLLVSKTKTTSGVCNSVISIKCKYSSMSKKQVSNFEKAGIKVNSGEAVITTTTETINADGTKSTTVTKEATKTTNGLGNSTSTETSNIGGKKVTTIKEVFLDNETDLLGRVKPTSFEFNGKNIISSDLNTVIKEMPEFRSAIYKAYNPKYAGFSDSIWKKVSVKLGISKAAKDISGTTEDEKLKKVQEEVKTNAANADDIKEGATKPDGKSKYSAEEAAAAKKLAQEATEATVEGTESVGKKVLNATKSAAGTTVNAVKLTGASDAACGVYKTVKAVSIAAKTARALQLAKYAMLFLNVADQIKAGTAKADDVSYLGKILTTETTGEDGKQKSATDSFGYKYAAYGDHGTMPTSSSRFMAGGGLTGKMSNLMSMIKSKTGSNPDATCAILANPFIQGISLISGVFAWIGGETIVLGAYDVAKVAAISALSVASFFLPSMLDDIVAGVLVDETTVGEDAGDAITSGASGIMSAAAKLGGNAPLTTTQATSYSELGKAINNEQKSDVAVNQFDISDTNSFISKLASTLIPYTSKVTSIYSGIGSIISLSSNSISNILTTNSYATTTEEFSMCSDLDYQAAGVATDPFCNVIYGIDTDALEIDPNTVNDELLNVSYYDTSLSKVIDRPQIDEETGDPINEYSDFVEKCIDRTTPIGTADDSNDNGSYCMFGESYKIGSTSINNKYYYLHYIDQRVNNGMDGEDETLNAAIDSGYDTNLSFYDSTENNKSNSNNFIAKIFNFFGIGN